MNYLKIRIEAKQFTIGLMENNPSTFGTTREVNNKIAFLRFEVMRLNKLLDSWH